MSFGALNHDGHFHHFQFVSPPWVGYESSIGEQHSLTHSRLFDNESKIVAGITLKKTALAF